MPLVLIVRVFTNLLNPPINHKSNLLTRCYKNSDMYNESPFSFRHD